MGHYKQSQRLPKNILYLNDNLLPGLKRRWNMNTYRNKLTFCLHENNVRFVLESSWENEKKEIVLLKSG
jgi:hypothetical protein